MRTTRCLALLTLSLAGVAGCQKTIHEVRAPVQELGSHETMRVSPNRGDGAKLTLMPSSHAIADSAGAGSLESGFSSLA